jgi:hypothetical protein
MGKGKVVAHACHASKFPIGGGKDSVKASLTTTGH